MHLCRCRHLLLISFGDLLDLGRAARCFFFLLVAVGLCTWWCCIVFKGCQGGDPSGGYRSAFCELDVIARGQLVLVICDFNVEPTKVPCLSKRILAGLWVDLEAAWAGAADVAPYHHL